MTRLKSILIEVHPKHQSRMNQRYTWETLNYLRKDKFASITYKASIQKSLKTKNYNCHINKLVKTTSCYDKFYMLKLNCSFPWIQNYAGNLDKCGPKEYIKDLINIIKGVITPNTELFKEIQKFGCSIPKCMNTKWAEAKAEGFQTRANKSQILLRFPSSSEVCTNIF